jgi:Zn-dependent M28 family amino/carboxypeptidase
VIRTLLTLLALLFAAARLAAQEPDLPNADQAAAEATEAAILAHTRFLASDLFEGRGPGTRGDSLAQAYVAAQLEELGLEPAAPGGSWLQPVPLVSLTSSAPDVLTLAAAGGATLELRRVDEWVAYTGRQTPRSVLADAEIVFVGYGIVAPEEEWDDYKDADVAGKVLLFLNNDPTGDRFAGDTRLYYGRWSYKYEIAAEKGAAGAFVIHTTPSAGYPWQVVQSSFGGTEFELPAAPGEKRIDVRGWVTEEAAGRIAALGGHELAALVAAAQRPDFEPVPLGVRLDLEITTQIEETGTANVIGRLPGRAATGAGSDEAVLFTAHFDHLGMGRAVEGDSIYNGARDNALGTASLLAIARAFAALPEPPARSILFAAVGAEEQGLLGSEYLAKNPPIQICDIVADINMDGGNIFGRARDVRQIGRGKSSLDDELDRFARQQERVVEPEEFPDKGYFYRSDQFNLAKEGVPALYLGESVDFVGRPEGWGVERSDEWREKDYHQPSDEITDAWDLAGQVEDARLLFRVGYAVAEAPEPPRWNAGDEFEAARLACGS